MTVKEMLNNMSSIEVIKLQVSDNEILTHSGYYKKDDILLEYFYDCEVEHRVDIDSHTTLVISLPRTKSLKQFRKAESDAYRLIGKMMKNSFDEGYRGYPIESDFSSCDSCEHCNKTDTKNKMPKLEPGMVIVIDCLESELVCTVLKINHNGTIQVIGLQDGEFFLTLPEHIIGIYKCNGVNRGAGKLIPLIWERSEPKEISKELAESILCEKLGEDIRIVGE